MKKIALLLIAIAPFSSCLSQGVIWSENFGTGCNEAQLASNYVGTNGAWSIIDLTSVNNASNKFYVSATEAGMGAGNCGNGCLATGGTNATLHVGSVYIEYLTIPLLDADPGAAYNVGGIQSFDFISETNIVAQSPFIDCSGYGEMMLSFDYLEGGDTNLDDADLRYYNGSSWVTINLPKTATSCSGTQGLWTSFTYALPSEVSGISNFRLAFSWVNNDDGIGTDPSFAVDNITLSEVLPTTIQNDSEVGRLKIRNVQDGFELAFTAVDEQIFAVNMFDQLGRLIIRSYGNGNSTVMVNSTGLNGLFVLQVETKKGSITKKVMLN
jgi:hypothetical protein